MTSCTLSLKLSSLLLSVFLRNKVQKKVNARSPMKRPAHPVGKATFLGQAQFATSWPCTTITQYLVGTGLYYGGLEHVLLTAI
jgi:hypothetical protein